MYRNEPCATTIWAITNVLWHFLESITLSAHHHQSPPDQMPSGTRFVPCCNWVMLLYQVDAQFAEEETAFTQTSDTMTKQLLEAACLLVEVVRMPESCQFFFYRTDALLHLACLEFRVAHEDLLAKSTKEGATSSLRVYLELVGSKARERCGGCHQSRDDDVEMLTCRGLLRKWRDVGKGRVSRESCTLDLEVFLYKSMPKYIRDKDTRPVVVD